MGTFSIPARVQVRPHTYRGDAGFSISGTDDLGRHLKIFTYTREDAEAIRANIKSGRDATEHWRNP